MKANRVVFLPNISFTTYFLGRSKERKREGEEKCIIFFDFNFFYFLYKNVFVISISCLLFVFFYDFFGRAVISTFLLLVKRLSIEYLCPA